MSTVAEVFKKADEDVWQLQQRGELYWAERGLPESMQNRDPEAVQHNQIVRTLQAHQALIRFLLVKLTQNNDGILQENLEVEEV